MRERHVTGNLNRETLIKYTQALYMGLRRRTGSTAQFAYITTAEYLEKQPKFGETEQGLYRNRKVEEAQTGRSQRGYVDRPIAEGDGIGEYAESLTGK